MCGGAHLCVGCREGHSPKHVQATVPTLAVSSMLSLHSQVIPSWHFHATGRAGLRGAVAVLACEDDGSSGLGCGGGGRGGCG